MSFNSNRIVIIPTKRFGTHYYVEDFALPGDEIEEYGIYYEDTPVGVFWVCNHFNDSILLFMPMDVEIVEYIFSQMRVRSMKQG